jgi:hypothetical protein
MQELEIYSFALNKIKVGSGKKDREIQNTISAILKHFFNNKDRVLTYVFDSTDGKELVRKRLFQIWKAQSKETDNFVKIDASVVTDYLVYQTGIIFHPENRIGKNAIVESFQTIISELTIK